MRDLDTESLITVRCRTCREWLCVRPQGHKGGLPYPRVRGRVRGWCYCVRCYATAQQTEEARQRREARTTHPLRMPA
jgi:hypothetical protein